MTYSHNFHTFLESVDKSMSHNEIMDKYFEHFQYTSYPISLVESNDNEIFVYRISDSYEGLNPNDKNCFSYRRPLNSVKLGRANIPGKPVFYGSLDVVTAISEMKGKIEPNEKFYISRWKLKTDNLLKCFLMVNSKTLEPSNPLFNIAEKIKNEIIFKRSKEKEIYKLTHELGELFSIKGDQFYHITSAFSNHFLYNLNKESHQLGTALFFPSVEKNNETVNIAIPTDVADNSDIFQLENVHEAIMIKDESSTKDKVALRFNKKAIFKKNKVINWLLPNISISSIEFDNLELKLFDGTILKGKETANIQLFESFIPVKDVINNIISNEHSGFELPDKLNFKITEALFEHEEITRFMTVLKLDHGYKIPSNKSYSCIEWVQVPISLKLNFNEIESKSIH